MPIIFGNKQSGEAVSFDITERSVGFFCGDEKQADHVLGKFAGTVADGTPLVFVGKVRNAPKHRKSINIDGGLVPGLDIAPDRTASRLIGEMEGPMSRIGQGVLTRAVFEIATLQSALRKIGFTAALDALASFPQAIDQLESDHDDSDPEHECTTRLEKMLTRIPGYVPTIGRNQRKEVFEAYEKGMHDIHVFMSKAREGSIAGINLAYDWTPARASVRDTISAGGMVTRHDGRGVESVVNDIVECCHDVDTKVVVLSGSTRQYLNLPHGQGQSGTFGKLVLVTSMTGVIPDPATFSSICSSTHHDLVFATDGVVLPYESMKTLDPHAHEHFGKDRKEGAYAEASMQMQKIDFLDVLGEHVEVHDDESRRMIAEEKARARKALTLITKFIARSDSKPATSDTIHVFDRTKGMTSTVIEPKLRP